MSDHYGKEPRACASGSVRRVQTDAWQIDVPAGLDGDSPLLVIPTVHPRGDRRILRCAQVALDRGFRIHFVWLGVGTPSSDPLVGESLLPVPTSSAERIRLTGAVAQVARELHGDAWHIHDFYMLPAAKRWRRRTARGVIYDVHEYYADYYSARVPGTSFVRRAVRHLIQEYELRSASELGAVNVVAEKMALPFRQRGIRTSVSPNLPLLAQFANDAPTPFGSRRHVVLHTGTLTRQYGTTLLLQLAKRSSERRLPFEFWVMERYPDELYRQAFLKEMNEAGPPPSLRLIPPRPTHEMPALIGSAGFGLSVLAVDDPQAEMAIPSKIYEYVIQGLVVAVSPAPAQVEFVDEFAVGLVVSQDDVDGALDKMRSLADKPEETEERLSAKQRDAQERFTWEAVCVPQLGALFDELAQ